MSPAVPFFLLAYCEQQPLGVCSIQLVVVQHLQRCVLYRSPEAVYAAAQESTACRPAVCFAFDALAPALVGARPCSIVKQEWWFATDLLATAPWFWLAFAV